MRNDSLVLDYLQRAAHRLVAVRVLADLESWADVVRESQEIVEISLKALLRFSRIEVPRLRDVSPVTEENRSRLPRAVQEHVDELSDISRSLRRDRELAFCGSEDLTPSEFYKEHDAATALAQASRVVEVITSAVQTR